MDKVDDWVRTVSRLAEVAKSYPQSAHSAFTHSMSSQWTSLQRVMDGDGEEYAPLKNTIHQLFTLSLLGREVLGDEHTLFFLPAKLGGLAICDPTSTGSSAYTTSRAATEVIQTAIKTGDGVCMANHEQHCSSVLRDARAHCTKREKALLSSLLAEMPYDKRRTLKRITDGEASGWLTVLPLASEGFDLCGTQFRDQLALRYNHTPASFDKSCGCGERFSVQHALDCKNGGLVRRSHNDVRDSDVSLAEAAWGGVVVEPVLVAENNRTAHPALQAEWSVRGALEGNRVAFFDNRIVDSDAPCYRTANLSWEAIARRAACEKKRKYVRSGRRGAPGIDHSLRVQY